MNNKILIVFAVVFALSFAIVSGAGTNDGAGNDVNSGMNPTLKDGTSEENGLQEGNLVQNRIQTGSYVGEGGAMFKIQTQDNNRFMLESNGVKANCDCEMLQEQVQNKTRLSVKLSNGNNAEVKVMPDEASVKALERLRLKNCASENCSLELKEVGSGEEVKLAYELKTQRKAKFLGIFGTSMEVKAQISVENGDVANIDKPWWAFLASEPAE